MDFKSKGNRRSVGVCIQLPAFDVTSPPLHPDRAAVFFRIELISSQAVLIKKRERVKRSAGTGLRPSSPAIRFLNLWWLFELGV